MKALFVIGIFLMFGGIVVAAGRPVPKPGGPGIPPDEISKTTSRIITYSVFGGFVLVLISWVYSLKNQSN